MDEIHLQIIHNQQLMAPALVIVGAEGFFSLVLLAIGIYFGRGTRAAVNEVAQIARDVARMAERVDERTDRLGFYLFSRLGPADTK